MFAEYTRAELNENLIRICVSNCVVPVRSGNDFHGHRNSGAKNEGEKRFLQLYSVLALDAGCFPLALYCIFEFLSLEFHSIFFSTIVGVNMGFAPRLQPRESPQLSSAADRGLLPVLHEKQVRGLLLRT